MDSMTDVNNLREFTRVHVKLEAELQVGGKVLIKGRLGDISVNGVYLCCKGILPVNTNCDVLVILDGGLGAVSIRAKGTIRRVEEAGMAIQFTEILGEESFDHLRTLILLNSREQVKQVEQEYHGHVGLESID